LNLSQEHLFVKNLNKLSLNEESKLKLKLKKSLQPFSTTTNSNILQNPFEIKIMGRQPEIKKILFYLKKN